ncbi:flavodoxin [Clostridium paraputrificum]|uniref:flavodoxin n=1 Tax=Clostridium paraputrificum TaxID=29363 RepID=UPI003D33C542
MKIVYWSGTGNTEKMANLIASGIESEGKSSEVITVNEASDKIFNETDVVILGCPAMGDEVLEEGEFEPFIEEIKNKVSGKKIALFGSYGWGDGEWMRTWEERMISYGADILLEPLIIQYEPEGSTEEECIDFGKKLGKV